LPKRPPGSSERGARETMPSQAKIAAVEELTKTLKGATSIYLTDFTGMSVSMMSELRKKCREADVEYRVVKDTLTKLAAERAGVKEMIDYLEGPTALALGRSDQMAPARVLAEFAKAYKLPKMKAAYVEGRMFGESEVKILAALPPKEVLLGQFAGALRSPLVGFAGIINQVMWKLTATLDAVAKAMEKSGAGAAPREQAAPAAAEAAADQPPAGSEAGEGTDEQGAEAGEKAGEAGASGGDAKDGGSEDGAAGADGASGAPDEGEKSD